MMRTEVIEERIHSIGVTGKATPQNQKRQNQGDYQRHENDCRARANGVHERSVGSRASRTNDTQWCVLQACVRINL